MSLSGKIAVITGGSRGIGASTAKLLAKHGVHVVVSSRDKNACDKVVEEIKQNGGNATTIVADVAKEDDLKKLFEEVDNTFGGCDLVFANAGWEGDTRQGKDFLASNSDDIRKLFDINVYGSIFTAKFSLPLLKKRSGIIIFNSSVAAFGTPTEFSLPIGIHMYAVTKAAIDHLCRAMAAYEADGVKSYCLAPAVHDTQMVTDLVANIGGTFGWSTNDHFAAFNVIYKGKAQDPAHCGEVVLRIMNGSTKYKNCESIFVEGDYTFSGWDWYTYHKPMSVDVPFAKARDYEGNPKPFTPKEVADGH